jgi:hypothetical protein
MTGKTAGENVDDATVTAAVKSQLVLDKASNLTRVDVDTNHGVVYLNGVVNSPAQKARAQELAGRINGVKRWSIISRSLNVALATHSNPCLGSVKANLTLIRRRHRFLIFELRSRNGNSKTRSLLQN